jgi:hypothetical protein
MPTPQSNLSRLSPPPPPHNEIPKFPARGGVETDGCGDAERTVPFPCGFGGWPHATSDQMPLKVLSKKLRTVPRAKSLRWSDFKREGHVSYAHMAGRGGFVSHIKYSEANSPRGPFHLPKPDAETRAGQGCWGQIFVSPTVSFPRKREPLLGTRGPGFRDDSPTRPSPGRGGEEAPAYSATSLPFPRGG